MSFMRRGRKLPKVAVDDLIARARELGEKNRPQRKPMRDPDAYVRVVKRLAAPAGGGRSLFGGEQLEDDDE